MNKYRFAMLLACAIGIAFIAGDAFAAGHVAGSLVDPGTWLAAGAAGAAAGIVGSHGRKDDGGAPNTPEAITKEIRRIGDELKKTAEDALTEAKRAGTLSDESKKKADDLLLKQGELVSRLTAIEQGVVEIKDRGPSEPMRRKSLGEQFVESAGYKDSDSAKGKTTKERISLDVKISDLHRKAITTIGEGDDTAGGALVVTQRQPQIIESVPDRRLTIRDLLTPGRTGSNAIEYVRETGFTNAAGMHSEGDEKPESEIEFELVNTTVKTIAHWVQASRNILMDAAMLRDYIDGRLRYGLALKEEVQFLKGSGSGPNIHGIIPQATNYVAPFDIADVTFIDTLRLALLQAEFAEYPSTGIVLHPIDWAKIELTKDDMGRYIIGNPQGSLAPTLWNRPVVATQAMDQFQFLVGAFKLGAQIFDREDATVMVSTEDRDNFIKNMVTILAEERTALAVYRPEAFVEGTFEGGTE